MLPCASDSGRPPRPSYQHGINRRYSPLHADDAAPSCPYPECSQDPIGPWQAGSARHPKAPCPTSSPFGPTIPACTIRAALNLAPSRTLPNACADDSSTCRAQPAPRLASFNAALAEPNQGTNQGLLHAPNIANSFELKNLKKEAASQTSAPEDAQYSQGSPLFCKCLEASALGTEAFSNMPCLCLDSHKCQYAAALSRGDFQTPANDSAVKVLPTSADDIVPNLPVEVLPIDADAVVPTAAHDEEVIITTFLGSLMEPLHPTDGVDLAAALAAAEIKAESNADTIEEDDERRLTCCCHEPDPAVLPLLAADVQFRLLHEPVPATMHVAATPADDINDPQLAIDHPAPVEESTLIPQFVPAKILSMFADDGLQGSRLLVNFLGLIIPTLWQRSLMFHGLSIPSAGLMMRIEMKIQ
ncbi:hypothetical protein GOP47_0027060 [Adiantum capillus-veneris]|nr:hypothetical protein GOP47_0027060 [Adiantum capillus-veneris]